MPAEQATAAELPAGLDFDALRQRAITNLQRLAGSTWTDHNSHDPGITLLESLCYAITDLAYRSAHPVPDLLASLGAADGQAPSGMAGLFTPAQVLPSGPVTLDDLRRLLIDLPGVRNAWVDADTVALARHDAAQGLLLAPALPGAAQADADTPSPNVSLLQLRGLLRVRIEKSGLGEDVDGGALVRQATQLLQGWRALGEDFTEISVLDRMPVALEGTIALAPGADATETLAALLDAIARHIAPPLPFCSLREMLARGWRVDQIFEGPLLRRGFLDPADWAAAQRQTALRVSDLIQVVMAVPGVQAIRQLGFLRDGRSSSDWLLPIPAERCASFDMPGSRIQLQRAGLRVDHPALRAQARRLFEARQRRSAMPTGANGNVDLANDDVLAPPPGRARALASHASVQLHLPQVYGVGPAGLSGQEPPERHAQARQLKAYLMLFDQLLANQFAQLSQAARLLSFTDQSEATRFAQPVEDDGGALQLASVRRLPLPAHAAWLQAITDDPWADPGAADQRLGHRHRLADHLLARLGERWGEYRPMGDAWDDDAVAAADALAPRLRALYDKQAFLANYPRLSLRRGLGADVLADRTNDDSAAPAGLQQRLARLLGLDDADLPLHLVEHILLRPLPADAHQQGAILRAALSADPFSLQLSLVLPDGDPRWADADLRQRLAHSVAQETPAHLAVRLLWLPAAAFADFSAALVRWRALWGQALRQRLGGNAAAADAPDQHIALRSARNRVIDALGLGDTLPLTDLRVADGLAASGGMKVAFGRSARIAIDGAEAGMRYRLCGPDGVPLQPPVQADGQDGRLVLDSPAVTDDIRFRIQASKLQLAPGLQPQPPVLLAQAALVKVGLDTTLALQLPDLPLLDGSLASPLSGDVRLCPFGAQVRVQVLLSQEGVDYTLVVNGAPQGEPVVGNLDTITLVSPALAEDSTLAVQATKHFSAGTGGGGAAEQQLLDTVLRTAVLADPDRPLQLRPGPVLAYHHAGAVLRLQASQASARYQLWARRVRDADWQRTGVGDGAAAALLRATPDQPGVLPPAWGAGAAAPAGFAPLGEVLSGTGADLDLPLGLLTDDTVLLVQASKQHAGRDGALPGSVVGLAQPVLVLVRPDPRPALQLTLQAGAAVPQQLRVDGGQAGVAYQLVLPADAPPVPLAAYVHQRDDANPALNKGLGQLVIGIDLVVAADAALQTPLLVVLADDHTPDRLPRPERATAAPQLDLPTLPAGTRVALRAVKAQTGVDAPLALDANLPALAEATLAPAWLAPGGRASVTLAAAPAGRRLQLWHRGRALGESVEGTGQPVVLDAGVLFPLPGQADNDSPADSVLVLRAEAPASDTLAVATEQWLPVRQLPRADIALLLRAERVVVGDSGTVQLASSQPGVRYQLLHAADGAAPVPLGDARPGQGGPLLLTTGALLADVRLLVQATRADVAEATVVLAGSLLLQVVAQAVVPAGLPAALPAGPPVAPRPVPGVRATPVQPDPPV